MSDCHVRHPTVEEVLAEAQAAIPRFTPAEARAAVAAGAILVDIRPLAQRLRDGLVPDATVVDRNVLEWRLDPASEWRVPALTLRRLGVDAGDVIGGVEAWKEEGLPLSPSAQRVEMAR